MQFDSASIRRHHVGGPPYASYPAPMQFSGAFDPTAYAEALRRPRPEPAWAPLALGVLVPFRRTDPETGARGATYLEVLFREMALQRALVPPLHRVEQLHLGGGAPTYMSDGRLDALLGALHRNFRLVQGPDRDFAVAIDPRTVDPARMGFLGDLGFNRVSLRVPDLDGDGRPGPEGLPKEAETAAVLRAARKHGFRSVNVELPYGLPGQTPERFARTLEVVCRLEPDRIVLSGHVQRPERCAVGRGGAANALPDGETRLGFLALAVERLDRAGYAYVGMDEFAKPADALVRAQRDGTLRRTFQGYTTRDDCDLIGLGPGAVGSVGGVCCQNARDPDVYAAAIRSGRLAIDRGMRLTDDDLLVRSVIQDLTCHFRVDYAAFRARFGAAFTERFAAELRSLEPLRDEGLVRFDEDGLRVTERGRFLIRSVCMVFDRYLGAEIRPFSPAI